MQIPENIALVSDLLLLAFEEVFYAGDLNDLRNRFAIADKLYDRAIELYGPVFPNVGTARKEAVNEIERYRCD